MLSQPSAIRICIHIEDPAVTLVRPGTPISGAGKDVRPGGVERRFIANYAAETPIPKLRVGSARHSDGFLDFDAAGREALGSQAKRMAREGVVYDCDNGDFNPEAVCTARLRGWYCGNGFVSFLLTANLWLGSGHEARTCGIGLGAALVELSLQYSAPLGGADGLGGVEAHGTASGEFADTGVILVHQRRISTDDPTAMATQNSARIAGFCSTGRRLVTLGDGCIVLAVNAARLRQSL